MLVWNVINTCLCAFFRKDEGNLVRSFQDHMRDIRLKSLNTRAFHHYRISHFSRHWKAWCVYSTCLSASTYLIPIRIRYFGKSQETTRNTLGILNTWDPKMGVFLKSTEATPCGHLLTWKLIPKNPLADTKFWPPWPWFSHQKLLKIFKVL